MTALIDINVVLDVLFERQPFYSLSHQIWRACDEGKLTGYIAANTPPTIYYIARKILGKEKALEAVKLVLQAFGVAPVNRQVLESALRLAASDFEDSVQIACAQALGVDVLCTRDATGFSASPVAVLTPDALLAQLGG